MVPARVLNEMNWDPSSLTLRARDPVPRNLWEILRKLSSIRPPPGAPQIEYESNDLNSMTMYQKAVAWDMLMETADQSVREGNGYTEPWEMEKTAHQDLVENKDRRMAMMPANMRLLEGSVRIRLAFV